jgi:hypothetical protein
VYRTQVAWLTQDKRDSEDESEFADRLSEDMKKLELGQRALEMNRAVRSILCVPIKRENRCVMVLYADSTRLNAFPSDLQQKIKAAAEGFSGCLRPLAKQVPDTSNFQRDGVGDQLKEDPENYRELSVLRAYRSLTVNTEISEFNFDSTDFLVEGEKHAS